MKPQIMTEDDKNLGEACDTIFYQGNGCSQTQVLKYVGNQRITATTGELMWCTGRNNLSPLNVIYKPYLGSEDISDVNLRPFRTVISGLNPINILGSAITYGSNKSYGFHFTGPIPPSNASVRFHAPILSQVSIGQETDLYSHQKKYARWLLKEDKTKGLILWGVSRGTAATFCAYSKEKYPEVRLVILEGAIDSVQNILPKRITNVIKSKQVSDLITKGVTAGLSFFKRHNVMQYDPEGPSPLKSVANFPENTPVVFITSEVDKVVPCANTENIAKCLASKGKNDVYLLKLKKSSHPSYMFDNSEDRSTYEDFIHAIYKKYNLKHEPQLAARGEKMIKECTLHEVERIESNRLACF